MEPKPKEVSKADCGALDVNLSAGPHAPFSAVAHVACMHQDVFHFQNKICFQVRTLFSVTLLKRQT